MPLKQLMEQTEQEALALAMQQTGGNKLEAAKLLQISKSSFYEKWEKYSQRK